METAGPVSWRKSSYSSSNGGDCVEVGANAYTVAVRDSKNHCSEPLTIAPKVWSDFACRIKKLTHEGSAL
jgi:hypothetical protein